MFHSASARISTSLAVVFFAGLAQAEPGQNGKGGLQEKAQELRKRFDTNGNGKLDPQEMAAARQAMQAKGFPGMPGKGPLGKPNGPLNGKGQGDGNGPGREAMLKRFDANGDGKLDETERAAVRKAMEERGLGGPGKGPGNGPGREEILKRFDKDGDGKLNDEERATAMKAREDRKK